MKIEEIRKWQKRNEHYVNFSGSSWYKGTSLNWQAIPIEDVHDGYFVMERIVTGNEEKTKDRDNGLNSLETIYTLINKSYGSEKIAQWHSAEHKIIYLLANNLPLTIEEARKAPDHSEQCGVNNMLLADPEDSQLLEVIGVGEKIRKQVENYLSF